MCFLQNIIQTFKVDLSYFYRSNSHSTPIKIGIKILNFNQYIFSATSKICLTYKINTSNFIECPINRDRTRLYFDAVAPLL